MPNVQGVGWVSGWSGHVQKISLPAEFESQTVQPVASRYTDYAISVISDCMFVLFPSLSGIQIASVWQHYEGYQENEDRLAIKKNKIQINVIHYYYRPQVISLHSRHQYSDTCHRL